MFAGESVVHGKQPRVSGKDYQSTSFLPSQFCLVEVVAEKLLAELHEFVARAVKLIDIEIASASLFWTESLILRLHILRSEAMLTTLKRHGCLGGISYGT